MCPDGCLCSGRLAMNVLPRREVLKARNGYLVCRTCTLRVRTTTWHMTGRGGMADDSPRFGARLRDTRRRAGLTQEALAARAGISVAALRDLEQGRTVFPHPASAHRLARALGLTEVHLYSWRKATGEPGGTARLSPDPAAPETGPVAVSVLGPLEVRQGARRV